MAVVIPLVYRATDDPSQNPNAPSMGMFWVIAVLIGVTTFVGIATALSMSVRKQVRRWWFAEANGMSYEPKRDKAHPGMIFAIGKRRRATDVMRNRAPERPVEFGTWVYTTGSGKSEKTHTWGYLSLTLGTPLPHIVLDATDNNSIFGSNLPRRFRKHQRLQLEGDFDRHYALYCPQGYERDALYLFTPDVMARFIDSASTLDVEIVDNRVFFYSKRPFAIDKPQTWQRLFHVIATFLTKVDQWERWRDDRLARERGAGMTGSHHAPAAPPPPPVQALASAMGFANGMPPQPPQPLLPSDGEWQGSADNPYLGRKGVAAGGRRLQSSGNLIATIVAGVIVVGVIVINILARM